MNDIWHVSICQETSYSCAIATSERSTVDHPRIDAITNLPLRASPRRSKAIMQYISGTLKISIELRFPLSIMNPEILIQNH